MDRIYLDHAATTPLDKRVLDLEKELQQKKDTILSLEKENQELKVKADKYDSAQRIVLSTKGIDVIMKLQTENAANLKHAFETLGYKVG